MSANDVHDDAASDAVLERNLRALLVRCYVPVHADAPFRARARSACLAAVTAPDAARTPRRQGGASLRAWRPALAAAALLVLTLTALWFLFDDGASEARRDAILARGDVAVRLGAQARWQAFTPETDADPEDRDVVHVAFGDLPGTGVLQALTPRGLSLDLSGLSGADGGALLGRAASANFDVASGVHVALERGELSLIHAASGEPWLLQTAHGTLALEAGALSARAMGAQGVWLLLSPLESSGKVPSVARAFLESAAGRQSIAASRAVQLVRGVLQPLPGEGARPEMPQLPSSDAGGTGRRPEPLAPVVSPTEPETASAPPAPAPRLLQGIVRRAGAVVSDFRLILAPQEVPPRANPQARGVSSADGSFRWPDVEPGSYVLFVQASGSPMWIQRDLAVTADDPLPVLQVELATEGASMSGAVVDALSGAPVAGALVISETDAPSRLLDVDKHKLLDELGDTLTAHVVTDASGAFRLEHLSAGLQSLRVTAAGFGPAWSGELSVETGGLVEGLLFRLKPGANVRGRVIGEDGRPWAHVTMIASPQQDFVHPCVSFAEAQTDDDGRYQLSDLPEGAGIVLLFGDQASRERGFPPRLRPTLLSPGETATLDFQLATDSASAAPASPPAGAAQGCRLSGRLLDATGAPVAGLMVSIVRSGVGDEAAQQGWQGEVTGSDGGYSFSGVAAGVWKLGTGRGDGNSYSCVEDLVVPAEPELRHDLHLPTTELAGRVLRAADGEPLRHGFALLMRRDEQTLEWNFHGRCLADTTGNFRFEHLPAGRYRITAWDLDGDLGAQNGPELALAAGDVMAAADLLLAPGSSLLVHVRDARGQPVAGARVRLTNAAGEVQQFALTNRTDTDGRLPSRGIQPGLWRVVVTPPPDARLAGRELSVEVAAGPEQAVEVTLADAP